MGFVWVFFFYCEVRGFVLFSFHLGFFLLWGGVDVYNVINSLHKLFC